jgi:hypothetical protein
MQFDFQAMNPMDRYELLLGSASSTDHDRPTALSTLHRTACFSVVSHDPPIIMIAVLPHPERRLKDIAANVFATREFVANVPRSLAEALNITNVDAPPGTNKLTLAKLESTPSTSVRPPPIAKSPVAFECRLLTSLSFNSDQAVLFGEVVTAFFPTISCWMRLMASSTRRSSACLGPCGAMVLLDHGSI